MAEHTISATRGAIRLLESSLSVPGWTKDPGVLYSAGATLEQINLQFGEDKAPEKPTEEIGPDEVKALNDKVEAWATKDVEMTVSEKQREACKAAVKAAVENGRVTPTKHYMRLAETLGLVEK